MEHVTHPVKVVVTVMDLQSPLTAIKYEMEKELESKPTTIELLTYVQGVTQQLIKELDCRKKKDENYGR